MRIDIKRIEIHNFMSFGDEVFDFDKQHGMSLVTGKNFDIPNGKNGAGKSTLFATLLYGLYGQLSNKVKAENIANRYLDDKEVRVAVYLDLDGKTYKAVSGLNKRVQGYFNLFRIQEDGTEEDITKSSIAETRDYFENQLMHCDISLFLRTILLTSEQNYNFFNLKKQDKKDFIEKLFDIGMFGEMYARIHKDVLQSDKKIISHQNQLVVLNQNQDDYKKRIDAFKVQQQEEKAKLEGEIAKAEEVLASIQKSTVQKNTELIEKYQDASKKLYDAKFKVNEQITTKKLNVQKMTSEIQHNQHAKADRKAIINKHAELLSKLCSECKKVFDKYHSLSKYQGEIDDADQNIQSLSAQISKEKEACAALQKKMTEIDAKMQKAQQKIQELNSQYDKVRAKQSQAESNLSSLRSSLQQVVKKANPYADLLDETVKKIDSEVRLLEEITDSYKYLKKAEEIVSHESLKKFIIKDLIGIINSKIKGYLMKMGATFTCVFDENLDYQFVTDNGSCELQNFSCGEKKRLEIATCLSFRDFIAQRSNISSNILVVDEYIDSGIDTLAVESILQILKEFTVVSNQNIFIISHRSEVNNDIFDRTIEIQKKDGISSVHYL